MREKKIKIVLDADVIIHFSKGEMLSMLPKIFPECEYIVLNVVANELRQPTLSQLQNQINLLKSITLVKFGETSEERKEYARLTSIDRLGKGESASMVYCRFHHDVIGSSNLSDVTKYCDEYKITYLTTVDFLYYAIKRKLITTVDAEQFIYDVNSKGSILPQIDFSTYICDKM